MCHFRARMFVLFTQTVNVSSPLLDLKILMLEFLDLHEHFGDLSLAMSNLGFDFFCFRGFNRSSNFDL